MGLGMSVPSSVLDQEDGDQHRVDGCGPEGDPDQALTGVPLDCSADGVDGQRVASGDRDAASSNDVAPSIVKPAGLSSTSRSSVSMIATATGKVSIMALRKASRS